MVEQAASGMTEAVLRAMGDLAFEVSRDGIYTSCFGPMELMPMPPREMIGKHVRDVLPPDVAEDAARAVARVIEEGGVESFEYALELPGGRRHFEARVVALQSGNALAVIRDVTERKSAEAREAQTSLWLATTLASVSDALIATGGDGRIRLLNTLASELTGFEDHEAQGLPLERVLRLTDGTEPWMTDAAMATKVLTARDGTARIVEIAEALIRGSDARPIGRVWTFREVTARMRLSYWRRAMLVYNDRLASVREVRDILLHTVEYVVHEGNLADHCAVRLEADGSFAEEEAEASSAPPPYFKTRTVALRGKDRTLGRITFGYESPSLERAAWEAALESELAPRLALALDSCRLNGALKNAIASRDDVLAVVSHDLGNLLGAVLLQVEAFARKAERATVPAASSTIAKIGRASRRMNEIIGDLLDVAQADGAPLTIRPQRTLADVIVNDVVELLEPMASQKEQRITVDVGSTDGASTNDLLCDRERMSRVISNLVSNAIKFTPGGGSIVVRVESVGESHLRFSVDDSGPGVPDGEAERIFQPFARANASQPGKGLGLYIARRIVEAHGGSLEVERSNDGGARFTATVPRHPPV